jgi:hypothetical protein
VAQVKYDATLVTMPAMEQSIAKLGYSVGKTGAPRVRIKHDCKEGVRRMLRIKSSSPKT